MSLRLILAIAVVGLQQSSCSPPRGCRPLSQRVTSGSSTICAFGIPGVRSSLRDTTDGIDITLEVVGDPTELRERVHSALAETGPYRLSPESQQIARRLHLVSEATHAGLTVHATPIHPEELDEVRAAVRRRMNAATSSDCD